MSGGPVQALEVLTLRARQEPEAVAFVSAGGDRLTFGEWERRSDAVARGLAARGVGSGDRVALVFDNTGWLDCAVAYIAAHKAGAVPVVLGARFSPVELARLVHDSGARGVVGELELAAVQNHPEGGGGWIPWTAAATELEEGQPGDGTRARPQPGGPSELLYSTGPLRRPVVMSPSDKAPLAGAPGPALLTAPLGTVAGGSGLRLPLTEGTTAVVLDAFDAERLCALAQAHQVVSIQLVPTLAGLLVDSEAVDRHDLSSVKRVVLTSEAPPSVLAGLTRALPGAAVVTLPAPGVAPDPAVREDVEEVAPLAFSQQEYLWHEQLLPAVFNLPPLGRRLRGPLDVAALEKALDEIARRHRMLRTNFALQGREAVQVVARHRPVTLPVLDLSERSPAERQEEIEGLMVHGANLPFDLVSGVLFRPLLIRLGSDDHLLLVPRHHLTWDDWSVGVFHKELSELYGAFVNGQPSPLPDPPLQFGDFCRRHRAHLAGGGADAEISFWSQELAGAPFALELPLENPAASDEVPERLATPVTFTLPPLLAQQVRGLARQHRVTVFMAMLAAFGVVVGAYTGQEDLHLTSVVANRNRTDLENLLGCFAKKIPLRLRLAGDPAFSEVLASAREALIGALSHQDLPYERVVSRAIGREASAHGVVPRSTVMFQSLTAPRQRMALPGIEASPFDTSQTRARRLHVGSTTTEWGAGLYFGTFLALFIHDAPDSISLTARGVFHPASVERLFANFQTLLEDVVSDPQQRVSELEVSSGQEAQLLQAWNQTATDLPSEGTLSELFTASAGHHPARPAIVCGEETLSFAQLEARVGEVADALRGRGVGPGSLVGLGLGPSVDAIAAALGVWKAGATYVGLDPGEDGERLAPLGEEVGLALEVGSADQLAAPAGVFHCDSSGSPAESVVVSHRAALNLVAVTRRLWGDGSAPAGEITVWAGAGPYGEGFLSQMAALAAGRTLRVPVADPGDGSAVVSALAEGVVDQVECTPAELESMLAHGLRPALDGRAGPAVPVIVVRSAAPPAKRTWRALREVAQGGAVSAWWLWGPAACGFAATACPLVDAPARPTIGRPLPNVRCLVLDARGRLAPAGVPGELHVEGHGVGDGRRPTGWLARHRADGNIELLGEVEGCVPFRGLRIEPARMQGVLARCPGVAEVAVVVREDRPAPPRVVAYVVPLQEGSPPTLVELRSFLWSELPGYVWPAAVVVLPSLPRRADGRVDLDALPPPAEREGCGREPVPVTAEEQVLESLWADVEGVDSVGVEDDYGESFTFIEAVAIAHQAGTAATGREVASSRTVEMLAAALRKTGPGRADFPRC